MSGYVVLKKSIFGVLLICMNCLRKAEKHWVTSEVSQRSIRSERRRCFQWRRYCRMTCAQLLSSMEGFVSIMDSMGSDFSYVEIISTCSWSGIWEYGTMTDGRSEWVRPQQEQITRQMRRRSFPSGTFRERM